MKKILFDRARLVIGLMLISMTASAAQFSQLNKHITVQHGNYILHYDLNRGTGDLLWQNTPLIKAFHSQAQLSNVSPLLDSQQASTRTAQWDKVKGMAWGDGEKLTLTSRFSNGNAIEVHFWFFEQSPWILSDMQIASGQPLEVIKLTPIDARFADIGTGEDKRIYTTPYSNNFDFGVAPVNHFGLSQNGSDRLANPHEPMVKFNGISHWVTVLFDNRSYHGLVAGAATVQKWKSSQQLGEAKTLNGPLSQFSLYNWGGAQSGKHVDSDMFFIGYFDDYRDGLETYGKTYNQGEPRLHWQGEVPVGFNAFYSHDSYGKAPDMLDISDYVAQHLKPLGYQYINMDGGFQPSSYPQGMKAFSDSVHQRGLKAGGYLTPFTIYENWLDLPIDDTGYTHRDACLHDKKGQLIKTYLGTYALDMSHPAAQYIVRRNIKNYLNWGYDYIKLDFLDMGLYEGRHHDPAINGIQNYRIGMKIMRDEALASGRPVFLNASISPLLPAAFTHGRRTACDTSLGVANYSGIERQAFNSAASWWSNETLYDYNDGDMFLPESLLQGAARQGQRASLRLATAVALAGGHWLVGDNLPFVDDDRFAWLENKTLLDVAKQGLAARPVSMNNFYHAGEHSPAILTRSDAHGGQYVGLTNWREQPQRWVLSAKELGLADNRVSDLASNSEWQITEIYSGQSWQQKIGQLQFQLPAGGSALLHLSPAREKTVSSAKNLAQDKSITPIQNGFELDFHQPTTINQIVVQEKAPFAMRNYSLAYQDNDGWHTLVRGFIFGDNRTFAFPKITTQRLRIHYEQHEGNVVPPRIEAYNGETQVPAMHIVEENIGAATERTDLQGQQQLMQTFTLQQSDLPKLDVWLFERYLNAVPEDNFRIRLVVLDRTGTPGETLFSAALPPFNLPTRPAIYSLYPRLQELDMNKHYALIFSSEGSTSQPSGNNSYGISASTDNAYANGKLLRSSDGGKTWQEVANQDALLAIYSRAAIKQGGTK